MVLSCLTGNDDDEASAVGRLVGVRSGIDNDPRQRKSSDGQDKDIQLQRPSTRPL